MLGHVVPHEVLGFANHNKNYFIGLGGKETICASHMAAATYGIETTWERRLRLYEAASTGRKAGFEALPDVYFQVVMSDDPTESSGEVGVYVGDDLETYLMAAESQRKRKYYRCRPAHHENRGSHASR